MEAAIAERTETKANAFPCTLTAEDRERIGEVIATATGHRGNRKLHTFSREQVEKELFELKCFKQLKSKKWDEARFNHGFEKALRQVNPSFKLSAKIKLECMGVKENGQMKPPRLLIADGDVGQSWPYGL